MHYVCINDDMQHDKFTVSWYMYVHVIPAMQDRVIACAKCAQHREVYIWNIMGCVSEKCYVYRVQYIRVWRQSSLGVKSGWVYLLCIEFSQKRSRCGDRSYRSSLLE